MREIRGIAVNLSDSPDASGLSNDALPWPPAISLAMLSRARQRFRRRLVRYD